MASSWILLSFFWRATAHKCQKNYWFNHPDLRYLLAIAQSTRCNCAVWFCFCRRGDRSRIFDSSTISKGIHWVNMWVTIIFRYHTELINYTIDPLTNLPNTSRVALSSQHKCECFASFCCSGSLHPMKHDQSQDWFFTPLINELQDLDCEDRETLHTLYTSTTLTSSELVYWGYVCVRNVL